MIKNKLQIFFRSGKFLENFLHNIFPEKLHH